MLRLFLSIFFIIVAVQPVVGAEAGLLPLNLKFSMSKYEVMDHLKAFHGYKIDAGSPNKIAFLIPDTLTKTKTGMFLKFYSNRLVEITTGRYGMKKRYYDKYMKEMMSKVSQWKRDGIETVIESPENNMYVYRDLKQYVTVSGAKYKTGLQVTISFTEKRFQERKR